MIAFDVADVAGSTDATAAEVCFSASLLLSCCTKNSHVPLAGLLVCARVSGGKDKVPKSCVSFAGVGQGRAQNARNNVAITICLSSSIDRVNLLS